ncbi:ATPase PAAT [Frankliniella fusca]|uniref:ATPase PAAT n=1 Tax=Frankliniella fusca TaxID=407009 RepID=A0AAE1LLX0_9NEOP|nr:ATPase PAAT [Frankliniella fusca]
MSLEKVSVEISSSWKIGNQKTLQDAITVVPFSATKSNEDGALTDMVELESCVLLTQPEEENGNDKNADTSPRSCSVTLQLKSEVPSVISSVVIVCEAKLVEVYGAHNEYLKTVSADFVDEVDDMAVFCAEMTINQLTQNCTLKFARLNRLTDMWLYGIKVIWNVVDNLEASQSRQGFNFESVEQRLRESQTQLSSRAENCKNFLKMYSSLNDHNKSALGISDPLSVLSLLPSMSVDRRKMASSFLNATLQNCTPQGSDDMFKSSNSMKNVEKNSENDSNHSCCDKFESILQSHLTSMENRLLKALDERLAVLQLRQEQQFQSLLNLVLENNKIPIDVRCTSKDDNDSTLLLDQDSKLELAIKTMMDQRQDSTRRNNIGNTKENFLRNALMNLKFNEVLEGTSHTANSSATVQGNS